jgi:hypothetical protein
VNIHYGLAVVKTSDYVLLVIKTKRYIRIWAIASGCQSLQTICMLMCVFCIFKYMRLCVHALMQLWM